MCIALKWLRQYLHFIPHACAYLNECMCCRCLSIYSDFSHLYVHTDVCMRCVCGVAKLALGSGILLLIQTLLGIYKDMKWEKGNVVLLEKINACKTHQNILAAPKRALHQVFITSFFFFWQS